MSKRGYGCREGLAADHEPDAVRVADAAILDLPRHRGDEQHAESAHPPILHARLEIGRRHGSEGIVGRPRVLVVESDVSFRYLTHEPHGRLAVTAVAVRHRVGEELFHEEGEAEAALARKSG